MPSVASFDVFDTVLTRIVGDPRSVFLVCANRLQAAGIPTPLPTEFWQIRQQAEEASRGRCDQRETTLELIYKEVGNRLGWSATECSEAAGIELAVEEELIVPVPGAVERVRAARNAGKRVVFLSDMYLPSVFIVTQLSRHGFWMNGDHCLVSCEHQCNKAFGGLYQMLLERLGVRGQEVFHIGDNSQSDVQSALRAGVRAELDKACHLTPFEAILERHAVATSGLTSFFAGAARLTRLSASGSARDRTLATIAANVVAPVLCSYVLWILETAKAERLGRLYFVSRDGQILLRIARRLAPLLGVESDLRYLYGSRQAWHLPAMDSVEDGLGWILADTAFLSVRTAFRRVDLAPEAFAGELATAGLSSRRLDCNLTPAERLKLRSVFQSSRVAHAVQQRSKLARVTTLAYLREQGLFDGERFGFIDLGWQGSLQADLSHLLGESASAHCVGLYFGLTSSRYSSATDRRAFFADARISPESASQLAPMIELLETFCTADHGGVTGYEESASGIQPVLRTERNENAIAWGWPIVISAVDQFLSNISIERLDSGGAASLRPAVHEVLGQFWGKADRASILAWGAYPFETDQAGTYVRPFAHPYRLHNVVKFALTGRLKNDISASWQPVGAYSVSPLIIRIIIIVADRLHRVLRPYRAVLDRLKATSRLSTSKATL